MKKEHIITILIIVLVVSFGFFFNYFMSKDDYKELCIYEIPNHIKLECYGGNETRIINLFQPTLFEYKNALSQECNVKEELDDYGFRYEITVCNESLPFEKFG